MSRDPLPPLSEVMDLLLDAVCMCSPDGRILFVSDASERVFGYPRAEMVGRQMIDFVLPEDREKTLRAATDIMLDTLQPHFQNRVRRKDGTVGYLMWSARWSEQHQVSVGIARDITELQRAEAMQSALYAISEAAHTAQDQAGLFQRIHRIIGGLLPAINFFVAQYDQGQDRLSFPYWVDEREAQTAPRRLSTVSLTADVIRSGQALLLTPEQKPELAARFGPTASSEFESWLGVPLKSSRGVIGALVVQSHSDDVRYTEHDLRLLEFVSIQVAATIERKQHALWLERACRSDPLTGLANRDHLHQCLQHSLEQARTTGSVLAVLYIDLDDFKQINDCYGHGIGDSLLREAAERLRRCVRATDTVARMGGDEFVVLLNNLGLPEQAAIIAESIRAELALPFAQDRGHLQVSSSIGVAVYPDHAAALEELIRHSDQAMYQAKAGGGNRCLMAPMPAGCALPAPPPGQPETDPLMASSAAQS